MSRLADIEHAARAAGLFTRGVVALAPGELEGVASIVLLGMIGSRNWPAFASAPEYRDGRADPLDRWSERIVAALAQELGAAPLFPFRGPPYAPFQRWALGAEPVAPSPLGLLIHPDYGLWHSYRGALAFAEALEAPAAAARSKPCETCADKPCLQACPVGAFDGLGYDVDGCAAHVRTTAGDVCKLNGCLARRACPVGREYQQSPETAAFHMAAFLASRD